MKKFFALLMAAVMLFCFAGCANDENAEQILVAEKESA